MGYLLQDFVISPVHSPPLLSTRRHTNQDSKCQHHEDSAEGLHVQIHSRISGGFLFCFNTSCCICADEQSP